MLALDLRLSVGQTFIYRHQSTELETENPGQHVERYVTVNEWFQQQNRLTGGMAFRRCRLFNVNSIFLSVFFVTIHIQYILYFVTILIHYVGVSLISQFVFLICIFSTVINKNRHCSFLKQPQRTIVTVEPACKEVQKFINSCQHNLVSMRSLYAIHCNPSLAALRNQGFMISSFWYISRNQNCGVL